MAETTEMGRSVVAAAIPERQASLAPTAGRHGIRKLLNITHSSERHWKTSAAAEGHRRLLCA
eukprot:4487039-Pyramimonas_sp.AAC.1